jgi:hypothetical protein
MLWTSSNLYETTSGARTNVCASRPSTRHLSEQLWYSHSAPLFPQLLQVRSLGNYGVLATSREVRRPIWLCTRSRDALLRVILFPLIFLEFLVRNLLYLAQWALIHSKHFLQFRSSTLIMSVKAEKEAATATHMEETAMNNDEKNKRSDYSGAVQKTDAAEIALVRKLDMRIMPALFCMYFL